MTKTQTTWQNLADQLTTARETLGWDHPTTIALEAAEADACDAYLMEGGVA